MNRFYSVAVPEVDYSTIRLWTFPLIHTSSTLSMRRLTYESKIGSSQGIPRGLPRDARAGDIRQQVVQARTFVARACQNAGFANQRVCLLHRHALQGCARAG